MTNLSDCDLEAILCGGKSTEVKTYSVEEFNELMDLMSTVDDFDTVMGSEYKLLYSELDSDVSTDEYTELVPTAHIKKVSYETKVKENDELLVKILKWRHGKDKSASRRRNIAKVLGVSPKTVYKLEKQALALLHGGK